MNIKADILDVFETFVRQWRGMESLKATRNRTVAGPKVFPIGPIHE